tara:strand:- start:10476 stop:10790 length:315 start_codon:yes stop_codon:yes gene_type:complete
MPAFTTIFAGISALAGAKGVRDAKKSQKRQAAANAKQNRDAKTTALEAGKLESQDADAGVADISLGTSKAYDELLKKNALAKKSGSAGTSVGGLKGKATNIGGL